jgi:hypothetical protein
LASPAWAAGLGRNATLAQIQTRVASAISARLASLSRTIPAVNTNKWLTSTDKSALNATVEADQSALTGLGLKIQADTTVAQARADYESIFLNYRLYALALPQVRLAAAADDITGTVLPRLTDAQTRLAALLSGPDSGQNTTAVRSAIRRSGHGAGGIGLRVHGSPGPARRSGGIASHRRDHREECRSRGALTVCRESQSDGATLRGRG